MKSLIISSSYKISTVIIVTYNKLQKSEEMKGWKKGKRKVLGVPQSQTAALPRHQEEEEKDKTKQAQIEQTYKQQ